MISTGPPRVTVHDHAQVQLAGNIQPLFHEQHVDLFSFGAGLYGDQCAAQHAFRIFEGVLRRPHQHHAGLLRMLLEAALAAASRVNLRLDDGDLTAEGCECSGRLFGSVGHNAPGDCHASRRQQFFRLIFVNFHGTT